MTSLKRIPTRFRVTKVVSDKSKGQVELDLETTTEINERVDRYKCLARGNWFWAHLGIEADDFVNIINPIEEKQLNSDATPVMATLVVDNDNGLIIVQPDILISTTSLMSTSYCMRKAWLSRLFQGVGEASKAFLIGHVVHELFQESLRSKKISVGEIDDFFKTKLLNSVTLTLFELGITQYEFISEIEPYIKSISYWLETYLSKSYNEKKLFDIQRLHDIENSIWSTKYGLIGIIDVSVEIISYDRANRMRTRTLVPLELKTGKHSFSSQHSGQVILYSALMTEKHPQYKSIDGYLVYLKDETKTELVKSSHNTFRDIIILRNQFVRYYDQLSNVSFKNFFQVDDFTIKGPELTENTRSCERCEHQLDCALIHKCFDSSLLRNQNFEIGSNAISHLTPDDLEFFAKAITLLEVEKKYAITSDKSSHFWNIPSEDCERSFIGLSKMKIQLPGENVVAFERSDKGKEKLPVKLLTVNEELPANYSLLEDRRVAISEELSSSLKTNELYGSFCKQLCVAIGSIDKFSEEGKVIEIQLKKDQSIKLSKNSLYRIDFLQNMSNRPMAINFSNILRLMSPEEERIRELRDIVIRGRFPQSNINTCKILSFSKIFQSPILKELNFQQKKAVLGVLKTRCSLIYGSPGSGKTQTIVALLQTLVQLGFSVLVTAYTHAAVDNILLKLVKANVDQPTQNTDFLRIGSTRRIDSQLETYSDSVRTKEWIEKGNLTSLDSFYKSVPIVASTCLGIESHPIFAKRQFDFCILDEASQVLLSSSLGPIFLAKNFVLVGDQKQLPPVIQNHYARKEGLEESLFARLLKFADKENILVSGDSAEAFDRFEDFISKQNVNQIDGVRIFPLFIQYRMNMTIMDLANKLTYLGKLQCATDKVKYASLSQFLKPESTDVLDQETNEYLSKAVSSSLDDAVVFLDTCGIAKAYESSSPKSGSDPVIRSAASGSIGGFVVNNFEAVVIERLIQNLLRIYGKGETSLTGANIGVISPFKRQVGNIKEKIGKKFVDDNSIEINTVDQYQGRDKEVIIYSCVKSSEELSDFDDSQSSCISMSTVVDSELLKDERRLNVAVTRAKKKLIIIGNRRTLERYHPFQKMFSVLSPSQIVPLASFNCDDITHSMD